MRRGIAVVILVLLGADTAIAGDTETAGLGALRGRLVFRQQSFLLYEAESLTAAIELGFGRGRLSLGVANAFELPADESPGGTYVDDQTSFTGQLSGFDIDTGSERTYTLVFVFAW